VIHRVLSSEDLGMLSSLSLDKSLCCLLLLLLPYMGLFCLYSCNRSTHTHRQEIVCRRFEASDKSKDRILTNAEIIITWGKLESARPGRVPKPVWMDSRNKHFRQCVSSYRRACRGYLLQKQKKKTKNTYLDLSYGRARHCQLGGVCCRPCVWPL
jgi:hypothetical protein